MSEPAPRVYQVPSLHYSSKLVHTIEASANEQRCNWSPGNLTTVVMRTTRDTSQPVLELADL